MTNIGEVRNFLEQTAAELLPSSLCGMAGSLVASGKLLRAKLALACGSVLNTPCEELVKIAAAVELTHAATLLHDDVIDGGILRRGAPAFWTVHGAGAAVLTGDMLMIRAFELLADMPGGRAALLTELGRQVCAAEMRQELELRGQPGNWLECLEIARCKTGALFAFAAAAPVVQDDECRAALLECGFRIGTAYQLADDLLDAAGAEQAEGKSGGRDAQRGKVTALSAQDAPEDIPRFIEELLSGSLAGLAGRPDLRPALQDYVFSQIMPVIRRFTAGVRNS